MHQLRRKPCLHRVWQTACVPAPRLGEELGFKPGGKLKALALGQGMGPRAAELVETGAQRGLWVMLQVRAGLLHARLQAPAAGAALGARCLQHARFHFDRPPTIGAPATKNPARTATCCPSGSSPWTSCSSASRPASPTRTSACGSPPSRATRSRWEYCRCVPARVRARACACAAGWQPEHAQARCLLRGSLPLPPVALHAGHPPHHWSRPSAHSSSPPAFRPRSARSRS